MTLMLVRKHLDELKCIDSRLMDLDPIFLSGIVSAQKLLFWLRDSLPDDDEFENRIQVAMGTSEMDCPDDLWENLDGNLSALQSVRSSFKPFIYRTQDLFPDLQSLLDTLSRLPIKRGALRTPSGRALMENLKLCTRLCVSFSELLCSDSEQVAPNRLLNMLEPSRMAKWNLHSMGRGHSITLEYQLLRKNRVLPKQQTLSQLLDFESSLVRSVLVFESGVREPLFHS